MTLMLQTADATHLAFAAQRAFIRAHLDGGGLDAIAASLADLLGCIVTLEQDVAPPFRRVYAPDDQPDRHDGEPARTYPLAAGGSSFGRLVVAGTGALDPARQDAVEAAIAILAVELTKERSIQDVRWQLGGELLADLMSRSAPVNRRLSARADRFGLDASAPRRLIVVEAPVGSINERTLRLTIGNALLPAGHQVLMVEVGERRWAVASDASDQQLERLLDILVDEVEGCSVGVSRRTADLDRGAREALACARFSGLSGRTCRIVRADDLGPLHFLLTLEDPAVLADYVDDQLGPLLRDPRSHRNQLIDTLRAFLESNGHQPTVAARCHVHTSTVKYRLARIAEVLGRSLADANTRFELRLAVAVADVLDTLALAPALELRPQ